MLPKRFRVFFKDFIYKEQGGEGASKTEISLENLTSVWELYDIREVYFGTLILTCHIDHYLFITFTLIEANCINNIHTGEKVFCNYYIWVKIFYYTLVCASLPRFAGKEKPNIYRL